jgi:hypothetical protein
MMRVARLLVVTVFGLLVLVFAASVATATPNHSQALSVAALDQPTATPEQTAPPGPTLTPEQEATKSKQKLVIGVLAVVLVTSAATSGASAGRRRRAQPRAERSSIVID